jgi:hypothetical protein
MVLRVDVEEVWVSDKGWIAFGWDTDWVADPEVGPLER